ncbi:uncharacterized protein B0I36DRAFT_309866 [Microdochium trichocladiopsis]|uniref:Uncharacterized protein n=1 Tax=Microdochium trichocladiopsis TaxID=1682393 RepID=A0A9P8YHG1_9PEZI|nr:uncharacterized protein B0I36DRAFT_309866 [Microdochium trichocladiopsis]KAH7040073.1 hypothetical protein B0I36DRAFT_309866 [Microdochium trichocladiopsis]
MGGGPPEYEPVAPGSRQSPIATETPLSQSPSRTISHSAAAHIHHAANSVASSGPATAQLSCSPPADSTETAAPSLRTDRQSPTSRPIETTQDPTAAAAAARGRSATTSSLIRQRLQELPLESSLPTGIIKPQPILRTASTKSVSLRHPAPDITLPNTRASSIAQLEATAERLSMTSSIEDAIRDLHDEQKRIDSRRSSILAASVASANEGSELPYTFSRQISGTSSILEINNAARQGGYSPAAYVLSPASSLRSTTSRLRSGSTGLYKTRTLDDMEEASSSISRHGPGKGSVHSVRSMSKPALLTNIAELEPTTLTQEAMDAADRLPELAMEDDSTLRIPPLDPADRTPDAHQFEDQAAMDYWDQAVADSQRQPVQEPHDDDDARSHYAGSVGTFEQAELAFADFDGTHASPDSENDDEPVMPSFEQVQQGHVSFLMPHDMQNEHRDVASSALHNPRRSQHAMSTARPKSYLDPETGNTMLYYPARVPMMLNVPQRLSMKPKAEVRNKRRTQVLTEMSEMNRQSGMSWLPEFHNEPLMGPMLDHEATTTAPTDGNPDRALADLPPTSPPLDEVTEFQPMLRENPPTGNEEARKSQMSLMPRPDKRKSRMSTMDMLPPQLRASAFFDLPSETTALELKDGSATATLDSILDASAGAPVSAFTDHAFAGTLGSEVYGTEKKRKSTINRLSTGSALGLANRRSQMHLRKPSALSRHSRLAESLRNGSLKSDDGHEPGRTRLSASVDGRDDHGRHGHSSEDDDDRVHDDDDDEDQREGEEDDDDDEEGDEGEEEYHGPPTTLLAELQIRKQQQKLRTRVAAQAYPNGMHSTLLEMDAVAEVERKARKGKKINLAWEAPRAGDDSDSDDEDLPLGLLLATKSQGNLAAAVAELNRPMGLMEKREMEENEPLSQRRNRLLGPNAAPLRQPQSMALLGHERNASGMLHPHSPRVATRTPEEDENEEETLGARKLRLQAREKSDSALPEARPVSAAFTTELLSAFKGEEPETEDKKPNATTEEEETLGQRRRRLQAEKEAREREMGTGDMLGLSENPQPARAELPKTHSMADVLGAYGRRVVADDPRHAVEKMKQAEGMRYKQEQEQKLAAYRSQLPTNLSTPNLQAPGGYMLGRFNDGTGGGLGQPRASVVLNQFNEPSRQTGSPYLMNALNPMQGAMNPMQGYMQPSYSQQVFAAPSYNNPAFGAQGFVQPMMNPYGMAMPGQPPPLDRVEQWRQGVLQ